MSKAVIAGGSLGGLMTGLVMKSIGADAHIYERSPQVLDDRGAGIVMQAETKTFLIQYAGLSPKQTGVWLKYRQYLKREGTSAGPEGETEPGQRRINWRPFQLNPDMPLGGMNRKAYRTKKFGSWERSVAMDAELAAIGKSLEIQFNYDKVLVTPNTLAGHRLLWWAEQSGRQDYLAEALFHAYFTEGCDVGRHSVLSEIAAEVGLPPAEARSFLESEGGKKEVEKQALEGLKFGLQGVPFFVVNGLPAVSGAQRPQTFVEAFQQALGQ